MSRRVALPAFLLLAGCVVASVATVRADVNSLKQGSHVLQRRGDQSELLTIDSDKTERVEGRLVIFTGNVVMRRHNLLLYADRVTVHLDGSDRILRATAVGNVRITTSDCRRGTAGRAEYHHRDQLVVLSGDARLWPDDSFFVRGPIFIYLTFRGARDCGSPGDEILADDARDPGPDAHRAVGRISLRPGAPR
jgi:lipopolysaccharide transport protein LptA